MIQKSKKCTMPTWKDTLISDSETPTIRIAPNAENEEEPTHPKNEQLSDEVIVKHIPKTMQSRTTAILNRLKERPDIITWDKTGEVKLEDENIPQSNISDLISDALRARKNFNPTGSKEFYRIISNFFVYFCIFKSF